MPQHAPEDTQPDDDLSEIARTAAEDVARPPAGQPRSTITGRHDEGSGANETIDGLDEWQEAARHGAEDIPASEHGDEFKRLPVFDRGESEPKV